MMLNVLKRFGIKIILTYIKESQERQQENELVKNKKNQSQEQTLTTDLNLEHDPGSSTVTSGVSWLEG